MADIKLSGTMVTVDKAVLESVLDRLTEMHHDQFAAWLGPMEEQRQLLLALGYSDEECEKWKDENYG